MKKKLLIIIITIIAIVIFLIPKLKGWSSTVIDYWKNFLDEDWAGVDSKGRPLYNKNHTAVKGTLPKGSKIVRFWTYGLFLNSIGGGNNIYLPDEPCYWLDTVTTDRVYYPAGDILKVTIKTKDGDSFDKEIIPLVEGEALSYGLVEELKDVKYYKGSSKVYF